MIILRPLLTHLVSPLGRDQTLGGSLVKKIGKLHIVLGVLGALLVVGLHGSSMAQSTLSIGGSNAHFGTHTLSAGFTPDPKVINITSGGNLDTSRMNYGAGCRGYATSTPDAILNFNGNSRFLRFFVQAAGDTTLLVNDAQGNWHCNDDTVGTNPVVNLTNPPAGQYDIWVGSYRAGEQIRGTLNITELRSQMPH